MDDFVRNLKDNKINYLLDEPLSRHTSWKIGGPADCLIGITSEKDLKYILEQAQKYQIALTVIGAGSNILVSDLGIRGAVLKIAIQGVEILGEKGSSAPQDLEKIQPRLIQIEKDAYYDFSSLEYDESNLPEVAVKVGAGTVLAYAINYLIGKGVTGLQWFAGIPGTVGGAIYNNIHGGTHFISEFVQDVTVSDHKGNTSILSKKELVFDYDSSLLHDKDYIIISATLLLRKGDAQKASRTAISWAEQKKKVQPYNSAGCCFKNISPQESTRLGLPSNSWGYIIDKVLGLKGRTHNNAKISDKHAAFIENLGNAKAEDILALFELVASEAERKLGITPHAEIFFYGFPTKDIQRFL
jgi:UDP-N-acetylmuramate dehydrogenase